MSKQNKLQPYAAGSLSNFASSAFSGTAFDAKGNAIAGTGFKSLSSVSDDAGMIAFGTVMGGAGAALTGGNFWQGAVTGLVVSGLNHAMHQMDNEDGIDPPKKGQAAKSKTETMPEKLHKMFDTIEEVGAWMEIGGLVAAPFTGGTSMGVTVVGGYHSAVGTIGNVAVDIYEYATTNDPKYLKTATFRSVKALATLGLGKAIDRIPGGQYMTDKILLKTQVFVYEKLVSPAVQQRLILPTKK